MKKSLLLLFLFSINLAFGAIQPVEGINPSGTLPILFINTEDSKPIDQKEVYIDAEWWLDANGIGDFESIGSSESPQKLGIRGRGNTTWRHDGQKPYKLKLDKKASLLGMGKNKHWALLTRLWSNELYNDLLGFELGRKLEMPFSPNTQPIEVVLNGTYIGLYMLTETIRIDDNRLEINEQPDLNEDPESIDDGWLVEIDNNVEVEQIRIPIEQADDPWLRVTYHTPEVLSDIQSAWLMQQFTSIVDAVYQKNTIDNTWEEYIDTEALAKHWITEELMHNYDAYKGSCYLHKEKDGKWCFGPLWDLSWSCFDQKSYAIADASDQKLIYELASKPDLKKKAKEVWNYFDSNCGKDWVEPFLNNFKTKIEKAVEQSVKVWPDNPLDAEEGLRIILSSFNHYYDFCSWYFDVWCNTWNVEYELNCLSDENLGTDEENASLKPIVTFNGMERNSFPVVNGQNLTMEISGISKINSILINGKEIELNQISSNISVDINEITADTKIEISYTPLSTDKNDVLDIIDNDGTYEYYDLQGRKISSSNPTQGIYIRKSSMGKTEKVIVK